jgi:hypothetical protein
LPGGDGRKAQLKKVRARVRTPVARCVASARDGCPSALSHRSGFRGWEGMVWHGMAWDDMVGYGQ